MVIAIDGPAGSGKTTVSCKLAERLNISYLDTGATYRALTFKVLNDNLDLSDRDALKEIAENIDIKIERGKVYLQGEEVSKQIRSPSIDRNISLIVSYPEVREAMVRLQRAIVANKDFVVEGRDITTVVFPDAKFKFYLDADFLVRVKRRFEELKRRGIKVIFEELKEDLERRDRADRNRQIAPLKISSDALYIDTTNLSVEEVIETILNFMKQNGKR
jgi:cytidylate kinase